MSEKIENPDTLHKPGIIGRLVRILLGIATSVFLIEVVQSFPGILRVTSPTDKLLIGIAFSFYVLPYVINIGFHRNWNRLPQLIIIILAAVAIGFSYFMFGRIWGPPIALIAFLMLTYVLAHLSVSFFLAAILATPGCEMRSIPHLIGLISGRSSSVYTCPGGLSHLDQWEANLKK